MFLKKRRMSSRESIGGSLGMTEMEKAGAKRRKPRDPNESVLLSKDSMTLTIGTETTHDK